MTERFILGGLLRAVCGLLLFILAAVMIVSTRAVEWGVGWMTWIPALCMMFPAAALMQRRVFTWENGSLLCVQGWLWRRGWKITPSESTSLSVIPMAGFQAVTMNVAGKQFALATWLWRGTANRLVVWLDAQHSDGAWPKEQHQQAEWDK